MSIQKVRGCPKVESVERITKYRWSTKEYCKIRTVPGAYDKATEGFDLLMNLNVFEDNGNELLVPVGDVFQ
jgi:hypothetical protein